MIKCGNKVCMLYLYLLVLMYRRVCVYWCLCVCTQKLHRKIRTFGVDFQKHLETTHSNIPIIVTKCINELDERGTADITLPAYVTTCFCLGLDVRGIYRLSGAKTKMDRLCRVRC